MTEPTSTTEESTEPAAPPPAPADAAAATAEAPALPAPPAEEELVVEGDRLGIPDGSTRRIWEPGIIRPSLFFLIAVSVFTFVADIGSKTWAEKNLTGYPGMKVVWKDHMNLILAQNPGGAWGLLGKANDNVRRPFFLLVSVLAITFIMALYRRLQPRQRALKWGLPLVLGGALGNVYDRLRYGYVIDFIDVHMMWKGQIRHWPTFNVADIAICVGVALMAIDMFTAKRPHLTRAEPRTISIAGEPAAETKSDPEPVSKEVVETSLTPEDAAKAEAARSSETKDAS